jgi:hypothetical protein
MPPLITEKPSHFWTYAHLFLQMVDIELALCAKFVYTVVSTAQTCTHVAGRPYQ